MNELRVIKLLSAPVLERYHWLDGSMMTCPITLEKKCPICGFAKIAYHMSMHSGKINVNGLFSRPRYHFKSYSLVDFEEQDFKCGEGLLKKMVNHLRDGSWYREGWEAPVVFRVAKSGVGPMTMYDVQMFPQMEDFIFPDFDREFQIKFKPPSQKRLTELLMNEVGAAVHKDVTTAHKLMEKYR